MAVSLDEWRVQDINNEKVVELYLDNDPSFGSKLLSYCNEQDWARVALAHINGAR